MLKISIITVSFNSATTIEDTIKSVSSQSYRNIEYLVIDGGSRDNTVDIVTSYGSAVDIFVSEPDNGIYDAMNKGVALATGDVIGILNSDDVYYDDEVISKVVKKFSNDCVDCVYGDLVYVKESDTDTVVRHWQSSEFKQNSFRRGWHPPHPSFFVSRQVYEKYGNFDIEMKISADFELMLRFLERFGISSSYLPLTIVKMRMGGESNNSLQNIIIGNIGVLKAFNKNNIKVNNIMYPLYRILPKVLQILKNVVNHA